MARVLNVVIGDGWAEFSGYGSRGLYLELRRGRVPAYNTRSRRWVAQLQTARDMVALAESRGFQVAVVGAQAEDLSAAAGAEPAPPPPAAELEPTLW